MPPQLSYRLGGPTLKTPQISPGAVARRSGGTQLAPQHGQLSSRSSLLPLLHRRGVTDAAARGQQASARSQVEWHAPTDLAVGAGRFSRVFRVDTARRWVWHTPC